MAHTEQPASRGPADSRLSDEWHRWLAARHPVAVRLAEELWPAHAINEIYFNLQVNLRRVRRKRFAYDCLEKLLMIVWVGSPLLAGYLALADVGNGRFPASALLPLLTWAGLRPQGRISVWLATRDQDLYEQQLTYLACLSALAGSGIDAFRQTVHASLRPSTSQ